MKRALLLIIVLITTFSAAYADKYDGYYVTNEGDTVKCKIKISEPLLQKRELNPLSVSRNLRVVLANGKSYKFSPSQIQSFKITGLKNGTAEFKTMDNDKERFYQVLAEGKVNVYAFYSQHPYDHSPVPHFIAYKNSGEAVELKASNLEKQLSELVKDDKELYNAWVKKDTNSGMLTMIQLYNTRSLNMISKQNFTGDSTGKLTE